MAVDEIQFLNTLKGKHVKLTLKTSSYFGVIQRININKTLILTDVVSGDNGVKCPGSKMFFGHEVVNATLNCDMQCVHRNIDDDRLEDNLNVETFQPYRKTIALDDDEQECFNYVVIDEFHEKFGSAVLHIKKQNVISVGADGVEVFKHGRLCWLQIATKQKVYLFDILLLGARAFKNGLSMILENKRILKVADVMCFYSLTGGLLPDRVSTLQEVVSFHLKVPSSQLVSLQMKSQLTRVEHTDSSKMVLFAEERKMWSNRPCPTPLLKVMALSAIHLQPLRMVLLDTLMMDYMTLVDSYLNSSFYEPDELEHVNMESVLELPGELRQLEEMRRERKEWAADHYPVTQQGLLDRFHPRARPPSQTLPAAEVNSQQCATVELPSQVDPLLSKFPTGPRGANGVLSVDVCASPGSAEQPPVPANSSDLGEQVSANSSMSLGAGRGYTETSQDQVPREHWERNGSLKDGAPGHSHAPAQEVTPQPVTPQPGPSANDLPKNSRGPVHTNS
ncbi:piRNA biogenesis protein EXD1 [Liparis tanakae]|uniref:PiRNA biogenesis protein EXD1 n=1 Tax=Liparis tanakae TaxID=230148 RepID=A0A4Z2JDF3_9TELE|nr:piRNA biogenesis protein EXD1 [Liparis tanakae]